jgi:hypothetical protein
LLFLGFSLKLLSNPHPRMTKTESVAESLNALQSGDIEKAVMLCSNCSGGEGSLYANDTISIVRTILEDDYTPDTRLKERVLAPMRVVAAAIELWGVEEASQYAEITGDWNFRYQPTEALELLYSAGLEKHRLGGLTAMGASRIKVTFSETSPLCPTCRAIQGKTFTPAEAPALPLAECTGDTPCLGHYSAAKPTEPLLS